MSTSPDFKPWWQSKAVVGGLVALIAGIAGIFGVVLSEPEQSVIVESVLAIVGAVGGLLAVYGRVKANKAIK